MHQVAEMGPHGANCNRNITTSTMTPRAPKVAVSTQNFFPAWSCLHYGDSACTVGDLKGLKAVGTDGQRSILIPMAFTLSWQLKCRTDPRYQSQQRTPQRQHQHHLHAREKPSPILSIYTGRKSPEAWISKALCSATNFME